MKWHETISPAPARSNVWRAFWALMLVSHGPALVGVWQGWWTAGASFSGLESCAALSAAMSFFALKLFNPGFLHLRGDRRSWVAVLLILALIHADCLPVSSPGDPREWTAALVTATVVGAMLVLADPRRLARRMIVSTAAPGADRPNLLPPAWRDELPRFDRWLAPRAHALRAPPR